MSGAWTWEGDPPPPLPRPGAAGWARIAVRGTALAGLTFGCLALLLLLRLLERPLFGPRRPATPQITRFVCRNAFRILGIEYRVTGCPMAPPGAMVANHSSWLDIFALNAPASIYFVSKSEVRNWPGIGWLARATGTVFIARDRGRARLHRDTIRDRLRADHLLLFFPEGTSTDGRRVLDFRPTLFDAFYDGGAPDALVQPVLAFYAGPAGADPRFYGWWGDTGFGEHLLAVLAAPRQGGVHIRYLSPLRAASFDGRKSLAKAAENAIRAALDDEIAAERARRS